MGTRFIEGMGVWHFEGDEPTEEEMEMLLENAPEDEGDPFAIIPSQMQRPSRGTAPGQARRLDITGFPEQELNPNVGEGPLGIVPPSFRQRVRGAVESQPGLAQFLVEMGPSTGGALVGAAAGTSLAGPAGTIPGAVIGGGGGEVIAQELGITPASDLNIILASGGPLVGKALGEVARATRRLGGLSLTILPSARVAATRNIMGKSVAEFEKLGATILAKQKGLLSQSADDLYGAMRRAKIRIKPEMMQSTKTTIREMIEELEPKSGFKEVQEAINVLQRTEDTLLVNPNGILLTDLIDLRSLVGGAVGTAMSAGRGKAITKVRSASKVFRALNDDLTKISTSPFRKGRQARLALAGIKRAKLQFAISGMEEAVQRNITRSGDDIVLNVKGLNKWLISKTNPKLKRTFDKNFVDAVGKPEIEAMQRRLETLLKLTPAGSSPAGPGSIVIRGQAAKIGRGLGGAALGFLGTGGSATGAAIGGLAFAHAPEAITAIFTSKLGAKALAVATEAGKGSIGPKRWIVIGETVFRGLGQKSEVGRREEAPTRPVFSRQEIVAPKRGRGKVLSLTQDDGVIVEETRPVEEEITTSDKPTFSRKEQLTVSPGAKPRRPRRRLRDVEAPQ